MSLYRKRFAVHISHYLWYFHFKSMVYNLHRSIMKVLYCAIGFCKETNEQRMKTFLSEQHATNRNKDSNDEMVNEFKLTVVYFARPNPCRSVHARGFTSVHKNCGKSGLGLQAGEPSRAVGWGLGPLSRGPAFSKTPFWCTVLVHQYGLLKSTKTSGAHFFYKSSLFSLENYNKNPQLRTYIFRS